jgi:hypothetical protein
MNNDSEKGFVAVGEFMKSGASFAIGNGGKIIAAITLIVATLTTFTNITFTDISGEAFTISLMVMLLSSYLMYFSLEDAGEREGGECKEYLDANGKFLAVREKVGADNIEALREFCLDYAQKELVYRRANYLCEYGLSISDLNYYNNGKKYPRRIARHLRKAGEMKAVKLTPKDLLSRAHSASHSELSPPERTKMLSTILTLVPSTLCTIFTVSVILTAKNGLTPSTVIDGILKLSALPIVGFKGFLDGYRYATEAKISWLETKTRLLEKFLLSRKKVENQ